MSIKRLKEISEQYGFLETPEDLAICIERDKFMPLLVRCGRGREVVPALFLNERVEVIEAKGDYIRDISITVNGLKLLREQLAKFEATV